MQIFVGGWEGSVITIRFEGLIILEMGLVVGATINEKLTRGEKEESLDKAQFERLKRTRESRTT